MRVCSAIFKVSILTLATSVFSLAALADNASKFLGNIITLDEVPEDFETYWNQVASEYGCVWREVEKERGVYDFSKCDVAYNWAKENHAHFTYHALVSGSQKPEWLFNLNVDETKQAITDWLDAVKEHYPDLEMIIAVNEAVKNGNSYHSSFSSSKIVEALGGDTGNYEFVVTAFKMIRERWPNAILIYNDYNTILWNNKEAIDLLKKIKEQGAPVDAFGMQFHETIQQGTGVWCTSSATLKKALHEAYEQTDLPIYITQYLVPTAKDSLQKACYMEHIPILMETEYVAGVTLWGHIYNEKWCPIGSYAAECGGLINDGVERPAMTWLKQYFEEHFLDTLGQDNPTSIVQNIRHTPTSLQKYEAIDAFGNRLGVFTAYGLEAAVKSLRNSSAVKSSGIYFLRNRTTGKMQPVHVVK